MVDALILIAGLLLLALLSYAFVAVLGSVIDRARRKREEGEGPNHQDG
jgi:hypothetical protein